uniref:SAP domain-containing protein n=1 Tax=Aegilops tauschii subsp. strangulata TaxID=200361 RepID=A0A453K8A3_AEGTS
MDFAAMKRRELQALCKEHGLKANGSNADLAARLAATLSIPGGAEEDAVGVVVGKGCLKRSFGGASGGDSDAAKKVTFVLEEEEEAEVGGRRLLLSPVVARTRGRPRAAEALSRAQESGGERRRTRSQVGGDSADETDTGQVGADAVTRRHRRNAANLGAGDVVERVAGAVGRKTSAKAEQQELDSGEAVGRKHQLKRKASENDADNLDVSVQVGVSRRSTRSSAVQSEPAAAPSPVVHNKRGRKKAGDLKEQDRVKEQPTEIQHVGRTLRSGLVVAGPPLPTVSENKRSRSKVPEGETDVEKVAEVEISGRTTRSSSVPAAATSPIVVAKKRRKTKNVNSDEGQHTVPDVSNDSPVTRVLRNRAIQTIGSTDLKVALPTMLNAAKDGVEDGVAKQDGHVGSKKRKMLNRRATVATNGGEIPFSDSSGKASAMDMHVEVPGPVRRSMRKSVVPSFLEHETKGMHGDVEMKETVTKPVGRSTRRSVAPVILEKESKGLTKPVEIKETVTKPVGRSTWRSVATVILEKECKGLPKEMIPQVHVKRPTKKSLVPAMTVKGTKSIVTDMIPEARAGRSMRKPALAILNSKKNDHCEAAIREKCSSAKSEDLEKQQTVKQPVRRLTRKSFVPAVLEKDRKAVPAEMNPDAQFNNENGDHTKMKCAKGGHLEKQLVVKEPSRQSTHKSVAPHVIEKEIKGLQEESKSEVPVSTSVRKLACLNVVDKESKDHREIVPHVIEKESKGSQEESKSDVPVRTSVRKLAGPNAVDKESKDHSEIVRREESSVRTRSAQTKLQRSVQNDASLRQTRHRSSKLVISPLPSKPTASKGRPAKRSRTASLEEVMPAEEQKEDQIAYGGHTSDMIDVASSANSLESGVLPSPAEKSDLRDSHLNTQLEGTVVESSISHGKDVSNILEFELESTVVGTTEKPPSDLAIPDCTHVGALSEEALDSIENDAARCSPVLEQSPTGLQFLFSQGNIEEPDTHNTSPFFKNVMEESDVHKVECQGETVVSLKPDSYQGSDEYSIRVEESGGLMFSSQQNNEQEGFSVSTLRKDWVASVQLDSSEDLHHTVRDITRKDVICNEEEKTDFIPSDINAPHEKSHADEPAEHVSGVSGALFCISQSTTVVDEVNSDSSPLESVDALDNHIASSNTEGLQQDNIEECNLHNARVTEDIHASVMSEAAQVAVPESGKMLQPDVETLVLSDEQLKRKLEGDDLEVQSFSRGEDESPKQSTSCEDQSFLGSGICQTVSRRDTDVVCVKDHRDDCNQHSEGQLTLGNLESDMSEPALDERSESGISVLRAEETSPFPDEQLNTKLEGNTEQTLICDKDSSNVSLTEFLGNNHLSSLKDPTMDPCHDQELPNDMPAPKSPEESAVFLDDKVLGSVQSLSCDKDGSIVSDTGSLGNKNLSSMEDPSMDPCHVQELPCGPSMDPCHDQELPGDMPAPKSPKCSVGICQISASIGKGNHIAIDPHHTVKQLDNLNQSAAALLRNRENTPCPDTLEPSSDHLFVIDPSTPMEPLLTEAGLKVGSSDKKLPMEQVQQDDLQVQEGTVGKTALGSATPECKHECVSPDKAGPHSLKNERYPSSIAQSSFDLQPFSLQDDVQVHEGTLEKTAQGSATPECKDEYGFPDEADPHSLKNERGSLGVEQSLSLPALFSQESIEEPSECVALSSASVQAETGVNESKPGLDNDTTVDFSTVSKSEDCLVTSQQDNEDEGLTKASNEQEQVATGQLDLEAASIMEDADSEEVAYDEENKKPVHPTDINSLCQKINVSGPVEHASGLGDALLSSSLIACTDDSDVHLSSNPCLFESTDFPDEIDWSNTEALQQGLKKQQCDERKEYQVPFGAGNDMIEAGTKDINSGVPPLRAEETSNMRDEQLNTKLPRTEVAEFGLSCDKGSNNYLDTESVVNSVCTNIPSDSSLPTDCSTDDYQQMELFEGPAEQKSPEDASMCYKDSDPRAVTATIEKPSPSFDLAIPDFKHEGPLSEEAVYSMKNDTESCSRDHRRSSIGLRHLFSQESFKGPDVHDDLVLPSTENEDDSNTRHAEKIVSSEPDSHQGSPVDLSIVEEIKGLFSSERDDEQGFLSPGHKTECIASARLDSSEDCNLVKRDINTEVICKEEEKQELVPSSDTRTLHETSNTDEPDEQRITLLQAAETSASADKQLSSELEDDEFKEHNFSSEETIGIFGVGSVKSNLFHLHEDSHTNPIQGKELPDNLSAPKSPEQSTFGQAESLLGSGICQAVVQRSTEEINTKLQHERKEECSKYIDDQTTLMSECALFGGSVSGTTLLPTAETSSLPDEQFGPMLECDEFEERDRSYDEDASYLFGSGSLKNNVPNLGHKEEYYEHSDDPAILSGGMPKPSPIRESESGVALQPAEETPALTNEHLNFEMEELGLCISDMSDTGLMENNDLSCLPKDTYMETWNEDEISIGTPAAKSPGESAVCPDDRVPGSVGICQTSGRRRIDEISTKLLSFKISSAVKGSYIAMDSADEPKQGDNLSPAALPGNWENVSAAKADNPAKQNSDCSVVKDSSS